MGLSEFTWMLTGLAAVVILLTRVRLSAEHAAGATGFSTTVLGAHTFFGVLALGLWIAALITAQSGIAFAAVGAWWVVVIAGLLLLLRWMPAHGRHATDKTGDDWGSGPGLSILGHIGMFLGVCYFTFVAVTSRL